MRCHGQYPDEEDHRRVLGLERRRWDNERLLRMLQGLADSREASRLVDLVTAVVDE